MSKTVNVPIKSSFVFQTYSSMKLLFELNDRNFLQSDYYEKNFPESNDLYRWVIKESGLINAGTTLLILYVLLVLPRETYAEKLRESFKEINKLIAKKHIECINTYKTKAIPTDYIKHIRNAVAHGKVTINEQNCIVFHDENKKHEEKFLISFTVEKLSEVVSYMQMAIMQKLYDLAIQESLES